MAKRNYKPKMTREEYKEKVEGESRDLRKLVVEQLASAMEQDGPDWTKSWSPRGGAPRNPFTGTVYAGGNFWALTAQMRSRGYTDPRFCTFKAAQKMGWHVRRGERACSVEYWAPVDRKDDDRAEDDDQERSDYVVLKKMHKVFNFEQIEGAPPLEEQGEVDGGRAYEVADALIDSSRCGVEESPGEEAYYSPALDEVHVPLREQFRSPEAFVSTLLHEMAHSTSVPLHREIHGYFEGEEAYAKEELVAELSATFSAATLGFGYSYSDGLDKDTEEYKNHVAYLKHWAGHLREQPDALFKAASAAQEATDFIIERYDDEAQKRGLTRPDLDQELHAAIEQANAEKAMKDPLPRAEAARHARDAAASAPARARERASSPLAGGCLEALQAVASGREGAQARLAQALARANEALAAVAPGRIGPASWGRQARCADGSLVTFAEFEEAVGFPTSSPEAVALAAAQLAAAGRISPADAAHASGDPAALAALVGGAGDPGASVTVTAVEPADLAETDLDALLEARPDLFGEADLDAHAELRAVVARAEERGGQATSTEAYAVEERPARASDGMEL